MGVFTLEYETVMHPRIEQAVQDALQYDVRIAALGVIEDGAEERVYNAYHPKFWSRRWNLVQNKGYEWEVDGNHLKITAVDALQNLYGDSHSEDLGDIIAEGWSNFNMPFERPWMNESIEANIGQIESALRTGMERQGF